MSLFDDSDLTDLSDLSARVLENNPVYRSNNSQDAESEKTVPKTTQQQSGLPKWSRTGISILTAALTASVTCYGTYLKLNGMHRDDLRKQAEIAQKTLMEQKNSMLVPVDDMKIYDAQTFHQADDDPASQEVKRESFRSDGSISIHHYFKDGCVHILRKRADGGIDSRWIFGDKAAHATLPSAKDSVAPKNASSPGSTASSTAPRQKSLSLQKVSFEASTNAAVIDLSAKNISVRRDESDSEVQQCLNPHPGAYTFQNQPVNQCIVQQVRTFYDGCMHVQLFNACNGSWDVNPDGSPRVNWIRCLH